jgi:hypothetical protein
MLPERTGRTLRCSENTATAPAIIAPLTTMTGNAATILAAVRGGLG